MLLGRVRTDPCYTGSSVVLPNWALDTIGMLLSEEDWAIRLFQSVTTLRAGCVNKLKKNQTTRRGLLGQVSKLLIQNSVAL